MVGISSLIFVITLANTKGTEKISCKIVNKTMNKELIP